MNIRTSLFVNAVTAGAVALAAVTAGAGPARADNDDLLKLLAGAAAVAVIAGALNGQSSGQAAPVTRANPLGGLLNGFGYAAPAPVVPTPLPQPVRTDRGPRLPAVCAVEIDGPSPVTYYPATCLQREGFAYRLPEYCAQQIRSRDLTGRIYEGECLRDAGFRTARSY